MTHQELEKSLAALEQTAAMHNPTADETAAAARIDAQIATLRSRKHLLDERKGALDDAAVAALAAGRSTPDQSARRQIEEEQRDLDEQLTLLARAQAEGTARLTARTRAHVAQIATIIQPLELAAVELTDALLQRLVDMDVVLNRVFRLRQLVNPAAGGFSVLSPEYYRHWRARVEAAGVLSASRERVA